MPFNNALKEALEKLLMNKYAGIKAAPIMPGLAESTMVMDKVRRDLNEPGYQAPTQTPAPLPPTPPTPPPVAVPTAPVAAPVAKGPVPPAQITPLESNPSAPVKAPTSPANEIQSIYGSKFDDKARQALYDDLASKRKENAGWGLLANTADMASKAGGGHPTTAYNDMNTRLVESEKVAKGDFESGREAKRSDAVANIALRKSGREETEYADANDPNAQMSKIAVGMATDLLGADKVAKMGWAPGKSTYADVIKLLPIIEKKIAAETAKTNKELSLSTRNDQFNEGLTDKLRTRIQTHPSYKAYQTVHGATNQARKAIANPSAYGDLSLIYSAIKGLDAQSAVREGEVKLMQEMASLKDRAGSYFKALASGQTLTDSQKADVGVILNRMDAIAKDNLDFTARPILEQAKRAKLQESEINPFYEAPKAAVAGAPIKAGWKVNR